MIDKIFKPQEVEEGIYKMWENGGYFTPHPPVGGSERAPRKKPFTIILPPPNASGKMHIGNVLMIAIEDILIRWHRMKGEPALWLPGTDHAGIETQITFERELKKQSRSRFNFDRDSLYREIWQFVQNNKKLVEDQIRRMGASVDWSRNRFTLDPEVIKTVCGTFEKLASDNLVYRDDYIVNYCPVCGTTFADIEVEHKERGDPLYYMKYGPFTIATVRPESKFRDTALAVNPKDKRYRSWLGKTLEIPGLLGKIMMTVIPDPEVNPRFGTGIMKVTPAHDPHDFGLSKKFNLPVTPIIDLDGRMDFSWFLSGKDVTPLYLERAKKYHGQKVREARKLMVEDLKVDGLLVKIDETYMHSVPVCKAGHDIEPTVLPNWFIRVESLKKPAWEAVKKGKIKIFPKWRRVTYQRWMEVMHDWAISRQNVWGIRIPVWYSVSKNPYLEVAFLNDRKEVVSGRISEILKSYRLAEVEKSLQRLRATKQSVYSISLDRPGDGFLQETDTFDTWFSSGQWPLVTLGYPDSPDFKYFYPTSVLETGWEILSKWVSRMIMFGIYLTGKPPFESVYLHGIVRALDGKKMSKSLGNIVNPEEYLDQFGVDALRMGLVSGTANGKDFNFPRDKVVAYRNFANKVWNVARFILGSLEEREIKKYQDLPSFSKKLKGLTKEDKAIVRKLEQIIKKIDTNLEGFRFAQAGETIYQFVWHDLADQYLELSKPRLQHPTPGVGSGNGGLPDPVRLKSESDRGVGVMDDKVVVLSVLRHILITSLKLLHPFMPFVTEEIWQKIPREDNEPLIVSRWPGLDQN